MDLSKPIQNLGDGVALKLHVGSFGVRQDWGDRMTETARGAGSSFWDDLNRHMEDPEFERSFVETSLRIQAVDSLMNKIDERREFAYPEEN